MKIRRSTPFSSISSSPSPSSPSSCSSSSSCFSTISTTHSPSSSSSNPSSSSSSSSSSPLLTLPCNRRCHGLDLLVKAVHYVAGSIVGVPYIQRRIIRRRKPVLKFNNFIINSSNLDDRVLDIVQQNPCNKNKKSSKLKRRSKAVPSKYHDSVLQSWKTKDRPRKRSIEG